MKDNVPGAGVPVVTIALIALGALAWLLSLLHGGLLIALLDLGALAIFGRGVEARLGSARFAALVLCGGLAAFAVQAIVGASSNAPTLAASGAVAAVLGAYLALHPRARVLSVAVLPAFATILAVPAALLIALWLGLQALVGATGLDEPLSGAGGAWFAHLCALPLGTAAAAALVPRASDRRRGRPPRQPPQVGAPPTPQRTAR